ncbi:MAG: 1-acyl-sn-glycerol-3-phosphate acyltransferase [Flavobacteriales bacterium]|nr:1-acyl-sn-glycerol-3-phosphate acyltransferase [Flavobacteriales bacterium]
MATKVHNQDGWLYDPIYPDASTWPIVKLAHEREAFIKELVALSIENIKEQLGNNPANLKDELARTLYSERIRVSQTPWKADAPDEKEFWSKVKKDMVRINAGHENPHAFGHEDLIQRIVKRYAEEIAGVFDVNAYDFAKRFTTTLFSRLLNASQGKGMARLFETRHNLHDKIHLVGEIDHIRELAKRGTIIVVPTHFSNLDSMLIGWAIQSIGLPPVLYGAGLNLFGIKILAWFMNRLGAYKVDRRKKNMLYLETLKMYSELSLRRGCNGLFFPGGTRSRSGMLEKRLKLGLLGTALQAQRLNFENDGEEAKKIFVVPVTINYNFVLEAQSLIDQHLKISGQEQYYVENDDFSTSTKMIKFIYRFFTASSEIAVRFGTPMDLFGNRLDEEGRSFDPHGNEVDIKKYFYSNGEISKDLQRDAEYTRMLGEEIVKRYHREAVVFSSQVVAFAAFRIIKARYSKMDLYGLMRLPSEDLTIRPKQLMDAVGKLVERLREMYANGEIQLEKEVQEGSIANIVKKGVANLGIYHAKLPLMYNEDKDFQSQDIKVLFFYHNRLEGYGLHKFI